MISGKFEEISFVEQQSSTNQKKTSYREKCHNFGGIRHASIHPWGILKSGVPFHAYNIQLSQEF